MSDLKLFLDDLAEESQKKVRDPKPINDFIVGSFIEVDSHRVFLHEREIAFNKEGNLTTSKPEIPTWLYIYSKIFNLASPEEIIFLDTETTGLDRGANTYAFLTGVLFMREEKWHLKQYFIESPENEVLLMQVLSELLSEFKILVSYNGKCYDIPLLDNRFKYHKNQYSIRNLDFLDLLHLSRRFWKPLLQGCKLQNIEAVILNYIRDYSNDIPGEFIPKTYFDYLATTNAEEISHVFYHNEQDLFSLTRILTICQNLDFTNLDYLNKYKIDNSNLAKFLVDIGLNDIALPLLKTLAANQSVSEDSLLLLAKILKKDNEHQLAIDYLKIKETNSPHACLEISKLFEHKIKDLPQALNYAKKAYLMLHEESEFKLELIAEAEKRITRIKGKIER
ncbi:ribonuclease H-like domain-containing protein [bacterium]|nr:ribonuclease H-like domain-containing protein [bacterium]